MEESVIQTPNFIQENPNLETPTNVPSVENNPPSVPPALKPKNKLIPILLIILILSVLGVGGIYAYKNFFVKTPEPTSTPVPTPESTPDPTADWETYTNNKRGYSMRYPTDWTTKEVSEERPQFGDKVEYVVFYSPTKDYALTFGVRNKGETVKLTGRTGTSEGDFVEGTPIYINNNTVPAKNLVSQNKLKAVFYYQTNTGTFSLDGREAYADFDRITYDQNHETDLSKSQQQLLLVANQILSTFKFTDTSVTDQRSIVENFVKAKVFSYGKSHGLTSENQIIVRIDYLTDSLAAGGIGFTPDVEGSGEAWYAAKISGQWNMVLETQQPPTCNVMAQYGFPKSVYGECTTIVD